MMDILSGSTLRFINGFSIDQYNYIGDGSRVQPRALDRVMCTLWTPCGPARPGHRLPKRMIRFIALRNVFIYKFDC